MHISQKIARVCRVWPHRNSFSNNLTTQRYAEMKRLLSKDSFKKENLMRTSVTTLYISFFVLLPTYSSANTDVPTIMTEEWPPYNYIEDGQLKGFSVELVQAMMHELGIVAEIRALPGARGEHYLQTYSNHMLFSLFRTPERERIFNWIGPISEESVYFFKKRDNSNLSVKTLQDAKEVKRIGSRREGMILRNLMEKGFNNIATQTRPDEILRLVIQGNYDLLANTSLAVSYRLKLHGYPENALQRTPVILFSLPLYIGCSKDMPESTIQKWQDVLDKLKRNGVYDVIYNKYLNKEIIQ